MGKKGCLEVLTDLVEKVSTVAKEQVLESIKKIEGVSDVNLNLVWEPPWDKDKMSEAAKLELNL